MNLKKIIVKFDKFKIFVRRKFPYFYKLIYYFWWKYTYKNIWLLLFKPKGVLIYVGLNKGYTFENLCYKYELSVGYEANPDLFLELKEKFKNRKNIRIFNFAATDKNSEESFYISNNIDMVSSSLSKFSIELRKKIGFKKELKVQTINLGEHLESMNINFIDEYISDAQGYDYKILTSLKNFILENKIKKITCEVLRNEKDNPYYEIENYEYLFDNFLPIQYEKIGFGSINSKTGKFEDIPDYYDFIDITWINNIIV